MNKPLDEGNTLKLRKDVIKNIAIIFLAVMLVLTFFSNSIMNKSLPEVAVRYVESGTVSEKIRGNGTVESEDPYSVVITDTRKISGVALQVGDEVEKDQVLFYLEDSESEELQKAEEDLEKLILTYTAGALNGEMSDEAYKKATAGNVASMAVYESQIEAAKQRLKAANDKLESIKRQQMVADGQSSSDVEAQIKEKGEELEKVKSDLLDAEKQYGELETIVSTNSASAMNMEAAELDEANAHAKYDTERNIALEAMGDADAAVTAAINELKVMDSAKYADVNSFDDIKAMVFDDNGMIADANALNDWAKAHANTYASNGGIEYPESKLMDLSDAYKDYLDKQAVLKESGEKLAAYRDASSRLNTAKANVDSLKNKRDELSTTIAKLTNDKDANTAGNTQLVNDLKLAKADAEAECAKADEDYKQLLKDISKTLDLTGQNSIIRNQREKVERLKAESVGATITAPVSGTILSLNKTAGETTTAGEALAKIRVAGKPSVLKVNVTAQQAAKVKPGEKATLQNAWYYNNVDITLSKILPEPTSNGKTKILVFNVSGDVSDGATLNIELGQNAQNFDKVVPNSAIKEDNKGKFVLLIEEKGTPFGTRYKAKRVDVEVLASDDNVTAISADIPDWSYVITTADKPVSAGMQVRLSDNQY